MSGKKYYDEDRFIGRLLLDGVDVKKRQAN